MLDVVIFIIMGIIVLAAIALVALVLFLLCTQDLGILVGIGLVSFAIFFNFININKRK